MSKAKVVLDKQQQLPFQLSTRTGHLKGGEISRGELVRNATKETLRRCRLSREEIADKMSLISGSRVSVHMLNSFVAPSKRGWRFPLEFAAALALITGDTQVLRAALAPYFDVIDQQGQMILEYGRERLKERFGSRKIQTLEQAALKLVAEGK
jgi:hypothetical protein